MAKKDYTFYYEECRYLLICPDIDYLKMTGDPFLTYQYKELCSKSPDKHTCFYYKRFYDTERNFKKLNRLNNKKGD